MPRLATIFALFIFALPAVAQSTDSNMTRDRVIEILLALDPDMRASGIGLEITIEDVPVLVVMDERADRMRAMVSIRSTADMTEDDMRRVMQANFDTTLDARYAISNGRLWGTYIHPLSPLKRDQLISGIGQTVNLALTYGSFFTGGAMSFGGGDSGDLHRELIERLLDRGQDI